MAEFKPDFAWLLKRPLCFLAFGFGSGLAPFAPGTFGTLVALPLAFVLILLGIDGLLLAFLCVALFMWGIRICGYAEKESGVADHGGIVWDEIVAMMFILAFVPFKWDSWLMAFIGFRLIDAWKPWPVRWFDEKLSGGLGIMADDMVAAVMTLFIFWLVA